MTITETETRIAARAELIQKYPGLTLSGATPKSSHALGAANLRKQLKAAFPSIKFSVTTDSFAGGNSMDVRWTDGPTVAQVKEYSSRYAEGSFDGMTDSYNYSDSQFTSVFGGAKYVSACRTLSVVAQIAIGAQANCPFTYDQHGGLEFATSSDSHWFHEAARNTDLTGRV